MDQNKDEIKRQIIDIYNSPRTRARGHDGSYWQVRQTSGELRTSADPFPFLPTLPQPPHVLNMDSKTANELLAEYSSDVRGVVSGSMPSASVIPIEGVDLDRMASSRANFYTMFVAAMHPLIEFMAYTLQRHESSEKLNRAYKFANLCASTWSNQVFDRAPRVDFETFTIEVLESTKMMMAMSKAWYELVEIMLEVAPIAIRRADNPIILFPVRSGIGFPSLTVVESTLSHPRLVYLQIGG